MAPIQFLFTSAIVLSAAVVAAPINSNHVGAGKAGASAPSKHQSEPMRMADPGLSSVPMVGIDTQAMKSSAVAMAMQTPPSTASGKQSDGVFGVLNKLPIKRAEEGEERRQLDEVTSFLTSINSVAKRGEEQLEERQLGLIKTVPQAIGQAAQVEKLIANLPIKRDGSGILGGLGGLGGVLGGSVKRDVEGKKSHDETYTEKALKGFQGWMHHGTKDEQETPELPEIPSAAGLGDIAKRSDPVTGLLSGLLAKRETEGSETHDATYTEKALKGFEGWLHHDSKDKQKTPNVPSAADSLGLGDIAKRSDPVTGLLSGLLAKRDTEGAAHDETYTEKALKGFQGWIHHDSKDKQKTPNVPSAADSLGLGDIAKRSDPVTGLLSGLLAKRDTEGAAHDETYTEKALKGFQGWIHHGTKEDKEKTPEIPSTAESLGLADVVKRKSPTNAVTGLLGLLAKREDGEVDEDMIDAIAKRGSATDPVSGLLSGLLAKRDEMDSEVDGIAKRDVDDAIATASDALNNLAKRNGLDSVDALIKGLTKGGQLNNGLNIRQLNVLSSLATGALSNAGKAAGKLGKVAAGKHRRGNVDADSIAAAATAGMNVGNHHKAGNDDDESADVDDVAADVAEGEQTLHDATSPKAHAGGHLDKRQVPPIAGSDALSIVKGLVANPKAALTPVTKGVMVGGTALGDIAPH